MFRLVNGFWTETIPMGSDIKALQLVLYLHFPYFADIALFDTTSRALGGNWRTALARVTGISPLRGSLRAAPIACGCGWTGVSLLDCWRGSGSASNENRTAMRNSPPQAVLWTDGNRFAPSLAVFDADLVCTGGPGASSSVALASPSGASRQRTYPVAGYSLFQVHEGDATRGIPSLCIGNE